MNLVFADLSLFGAISYLIAGRFSTIGNYYKELDEETKDNIRTQGLIIMLFGLIFLY
ncbi:MAG: hypothetical protein ACTSRG_24045 [Candidatus Helarchaeota archaeon]